MWFCIKRKLTQGSMKFEMYAEPFLFNVSVHIICLSDYVTKKLLNSSYYTISLVHIRYCKDYHNNCITSVITAEENNLLIEQTL